MVPGDTRAANRRGILTMSAGMAAFVVNDSLVKVVSETLPSSQLIFIRGVFATTWLLVIAHVLGALPRIALIFQRRVAVRAGLDAFATMVYLTSVFHLPLANATAINMATPLVITVLAVLFLHEHVSVGRWLAIVTGFGGVMMIVQPSGEAFNAYALLCLAGTILHALRDLATRGIAPATPSILVTLSTAVAVTALAGTWGLFETWRPVPATSWLLLAAASVFLSAGYYLVIVALRSGEITLIAPFRYTGLLFALALGFGIWGDVPNALAWAGIALLVGAGLYVLHGAR